MTPETLTRLIDDLLTHANAASPPDSELMEAAARALRGIGAQVEALTAEQAQYDRMREGYMAAANKRVDALEASLASVTAEREQLAWDVEDAHAHRIAAQSRADAAEAQLAALSQGHKG